MLIRAPAIVVGSRAHGEHGSVVRVLTAEQGLLAGYVRGGRSRALRPVLIAGNDIIAELRARTESQLAAMTVELVHARSALMREPLAAAALEWVTALAASALPEGQAYPTIHDALGGVLDAIEAAPSARGWSGALLGYERVVIAQLGYELGEPTTGSAGLAETGRQLAEHVLTGRSAVALDARSRLVERLAQAMG